MLHYTNPHDWYPSKPYIPSPREYVAIVRGRMSHSFDYSPAFDESCFPMIVDSGASLAISPCRFDFVGKIKKVDLRLGGMAIEGKGEGELTVSNEGGGMLL